MKRICLVIPYFGKWPNWLPFFLKSCEFNPTINWLIFTDCGKPPHCPKNVKIIDFKLKDFNELASKKLKIKINTERVYKICDLRPAFGIIFEDYLKKFDFWGNTDLDIIYGNIRNFITPEILRSYELISAKKGHLVGHFTLYKNTKKINNIYAKIQGYNLIFQSSRNYIFDEANTLEFEVFPEKGKIKIIKMEGMVNLIKRLGKKKFLKYLFKDLVIDGLYMPRNTLIDFNEGNLLNLSKNKPSMYFHINNLKNGFWVPSGKIQKNFTINHYGIFYKKDIPLRKKINSLIYEVKFRIEYSNTFKKLAEYLRRKHPSFYFYIAKRLYSLPMEKVTK